MIVVGVFLLLIAKVGVLELQLENKITGFYAKSGRELKNNDMLFLIFTVEKGGIDAKNPLWQIRH